MDIPKLETPPAGSGARRWWWWLVPDLDDALRRFPVTLVLGLIGCGFLLAVADADLYGPVRGGWNVRPLAQTYFPLVASAVLLSLAIESWGEAAGRSQAATAVLAFGVAALLAVLHFLPLFAPGLSAQWLTLNAGIVGNGTILIALAATAEDTRGGAANMRILLALGAAAAAMAVAWFAVSLVASFFGGVQGQLFSGRLLPPAQVFMYALTLLLLLSWLANLPTPEEGKTQHGALVAQTELLRRIILPLLMVAIVGAVTVTIRQFVLHDPQTFVRGVPMIVGPASAILLLVTVAWLHALHAGKLGDSDGGPLVVGFVRVIPVFIAGLIAVCVYGLWAEWTAAHAVDPALPVTQQPLHVSYLNGIVMGWGIGVAAIISSVLALAVPAWRDLRLPLLVCGITLVVLGFGPMSRDRFTSKAAVADIEKALVAAGMKPDGRLIDAKSGKSISLEGHTTIVQNLRRLIAVDGLGALAPTFAGASDNPFAAAPPLDADRLGNAILKRLGFDPLFGKAVNEVRPVVHARPLTIIASRQATAGFGLPLAGYDRLSGPIFLTTNVAGARVPPPIRIDGNATEPRTGTTVVAPVPPAAFDAKIVAGAKLVLTRREGGAELTFDLAPLLAKIIAHEDIRFQIAERNRQRRQNQPPQTIKDDPVPLSISEPEPLESTGGIKARFVIERLQGNVNDGNIIINDALGWLIYNAADVEKKP